MPEESADEATDKGSQHFSVPGLPLVPEGTDFEKIQEELRTQTPRGVAILAGAYLEWRVRQAIKHRLYRWEVVPTGKTKPEPVGARLLGDDEIIGELGFSDQCKLAYCLGLVGPVGYCDLKRIARIRNRFAHHIEVNSFEDDAVVSKLCDQLESIQAQVKWVKRIADVDLPPPFKTENRRSMFMATVQLLWIMLFQIAAYRPVEWPNPEEKGPMFW